MHFSSTERWREDEQVSLPALPNGRAHATARRAESHNSDGSAKIRGGVGERELLAPNFLDTSTEMRFILCKFC